MSTAMFRTASLVLVLALVGCGDKKPPTTDPTTTAVVVNPKTAFAAGVKLIDTANPNWAAAATQFEAATTADPNYAKAWYNLGYTSERTGDFAKAETAYRKAVELDAAYTNATINLAGVLVKAGKAADAGASSRSSASPSAARSCRAAPSSSRSVSGPTVRCSTSQWVHCSMWKACVRTRVRREWDMGVT